MTVRIKQGIACIVLIAMMAGCMWLFAYQLAESLHEYASGLSATRGRIVGLDQ